MSKILKTLKYMKLKIIEIAYKIYPKLKNNYPRYKYGTPRCKKKEKKHTGKVKMRISRLAFLGCIRKIHYTVCSQPFWRVKRSTIGWRIPNSTENKVLS